MPVTPELPTAAQNVLVGHETSVRSPSGIVGGTAVSACQVRDVAAPAGADTTTVSPTTSEVAESIAPIPRSAFPLLITGRSEHGTGGLSTLVGSARLGRAQVRSMRPCSPSVT